MAVLVDQASNEPPLKSVPGAQNWELIKDLKLADPSFFQPGRIDAILGTDVFKYVMLDGLHVGVDEEPMAVIIIFGWAIMGDYKASPAQTSVNLHVVCKPGEDLNQLLQQFWEVEQVNTSFNDLLTTEERNAILIFKESVRQTSDGRYEVTMPRKTGHNHLGNSREQALKRFVSTEKSLNR